MKVETDNLIRVSTYARGEGVSPKTIYQWGKAGGIKIIEIDTVKFVVMNEPKPK